jgi:hypothetical protein
MNPTTLEPRRHVPPVGWPVEVFERVTDALAAALVSSYRREAARRGGNHAGPDHRGGDDGQERL